MDVKTAFVNGILEEEICIECLEGDVEKPEGDMVSPPTKVIYGL